ncbi:MAG: hypothetical protein K5657_04065 [Desulfovibrio sp.]|nr:hypothetical protein [Desulfovibrio sp.]
MLCLLLGGGIFAWLESHKVEIRDTVLSLLHKELGQKCVVAYVGVHFSPRPVLLIKGFESSGPLFSLTAERVLAVPSFSGLMRGLFIPSTIQFESPVLDVRSSFFDQPVSSAPKKEEAFPEPCIIIVENGTCTLNYPDSPVSLSGFDCYLKSHSTQSLKGDFLIEKVTFAVANVSCSLSDVLFLGDVDFRSLSRGNARFDVRGEFNGPEWVKNIAFHFSVRSNDDSWDAKTAIKGNIVKDRLLIPLSLSGYVSLARNGERVQGKNLALEFGRDRAVFSADYLLHENRLSGHIGVQRLSLVEWFGFGRLLPSGIMHSLDYIHDGRLDFELDSRGLRIPFAEAVCANAVFTGRGGVEDWRRPVVFFDMHAPEVDLIRAVPEAGGILPSEPYFGHGPFTPDGLEKKSEGDIDVSYDIRLGADMVAYGPLSFENARVLIHPPADPENDDIHIDAKASFYGGTVNASGVLSRVTELFYSVSANCKDVNANLLYRDFPVLPVLYGNLAAHTNFKSQGTTLDGFLKNLRGSAVLEVKRGTLVSGGHRGTQFSSCILRLDPLRQGMWQKKRLGLDGVWTAELEQPGVRAQIQSNGRVFFGKTADKSGVEIQNIDTGVTVRIDRGDGKPLALSGRGLLHLIPMQLVRLTDARVQLPGAEFRGEIGVRQKGFALETRGSWNIASLPLLLEGLSGKKHDLPSFLHTLNGKITLAAEGELLHFSDLQLSTKLGPVSGTLDLELGKQIRMTPRLTFKNLDADALLEGGTSRGPLNWQGVESLLLDGHLKIENLRFKNCPFTGITFSLSLKDRVLHLADVEGRLYGGHLNGSFTLVFSKVLEVQSTGRLSDCDLSLFSRDAVKNGRLFGKGKVRGAIRAAFSSFSEWPGCLWGDWVLDAREGGYQPFDKGGHSSEKSIPFSRLSASGTLEGGIVRSSDLVLKGDGLSLRGKGELNLGKMSFDGRFDVEKRGMPAFPLYVEGTFDKTKTSVGVGALVLNAVGGLFRGLIGIFAPK